jgi:hypothetical protein
MWSPTRLIRGQTGRAAAVAGAAEAPRPPATLLNSASANPPRWTKQFVGKQMVYFDDQFPQWNGVFSSSTGVIGGRDFKSLEAARSAVAQLRASNPEVRNGVVYLKSDEGKFAAFELDKPIEQTAGFIKLRKVPAEQVLGRDPRVIFVEDGTGRSVFLRGVVVGTIIV